MKRIGIEEGLSNIANYLKEEGYSVETLGSDINSSASKCKNLDAIITSDHNTDIMGISDTCSKIPIINANGLNEKEVEDMLKKNDVK